MAQLSGFESPTAHNQPDNQIHKIMDKDKSRQIIAEGCYDAALDAAKKCNGTLRFMLDLLERTKDEAELAGDERYAALCAAELRLNQAIYMLGRTNADKASRPAAPSAPRSRQNRNKRGLPGQRRAQRFDEVCRILQGLPGYKLHPSGLAIENAGDLSRLSLEKTAELHFLGYTDFLVRSPRGSI